MRLALGGLLFFFLFRFSLSENCLRVLARSFWVFVLRSRFSNICILGGGCGFFFVHEFNLAGLVPSLRYPGIPFFDTMAALGGPGGPPEQQKGHPVGWGQPAQQKCQPVLVDEVLVVGLPQGLCGPFGRRLGLTWIAKCVFHTGGAFLIFFLLGCCSWVGG